MKPRLPLPAPLRGAEIGTFAHNTITVRMPDIVRRTLAENNFPPNVVANMNALIDEIANGRIRDLTDGDDWAVYTAVYEGQDWLTPPWFFSETYFYRRLLEATGYFGDGSWGDKDPFAIQKVKGLAAARAGTRSLALLLIDWLKQGWQEAIFARLLAHDLWGNQVDLSLWPTDAEEKPDHADSASRREHLLADDTTAVTNHLTNKRTDQPSRIDFIIDNAGYELIGDLALTNYLLSCDFCQTVRLHLKNHPTFVSDATITDVLATIAHLQAEEYEEVGVWGRSLRGFVENGRLQLRTHPYWTSPLPGWEMPADLRDDLAPANLILSKGDANYRRHLGDRHWPYTTPFSDVVSYFPAPVVTLRTLKSDVLIGLPPGRQAVLDQKDPNWLINGRWGLIQFADLQCSDNASLLAFR